jgi:hypothetical protein
LFFVGEILDRGRICYGLMRVVHAHMLGFVLTALAMSALWDLFDIVVRPDLRQIGKPPCKEETPMLPFSEDK